MLVVRNMYRRPLGFLLAVSGLVRRFHYMGTCHIDSAVSGPHLFDVWNQSQYLGAAHFRFLGLLVFDVQGSSERGALQVGLFNE